MQRLREEAKVYADGEDVDPANFSEALFNKIFGDVAEDDDDIELNDDDDFSSKIDDIDEVVFFLEAFQAFADRDGAACQQLMQSCGAQEEAKFKQLTAEANNRAKKNEEKK